MKTIIATDQAPQAIGPYSQGVQVGDFIFFSGQIPLDPATGDMVGTTIEEQTEQVLKNLRGLLASCGLTPQHVVRTTVFLQDIADFAAFNALYATLFSEQPPARSTVQVSALPKGALVEIDMIAYKA